MVFKKSAVKDTKVYEIWEVLDKFGSYQILQYLFICVPTLFYTMANINYIFVVGDVPFRCHVEGCEDANAMFEVPWWPNGTDQCSKPVLNTSGPSCSEDSFTGLTEPCKRWVYQHHDSAVSELDLACKPWEVNSIGTIHNFGMLVAMLFTGWLTDRFGRKPMVVFSLVTTAIGVVKIFAKSYNAFLAIEFVEALVGGGHFSACTIVMIEITGRKHRILSGVAFAYAIYMGEAMFAVIAMFFPNWKVIVAIIYTPCILCLSLIYLLRESPRWQIVNGKTTDAIENLKKIAKVNKMEVNTQNLANLDETKLKEMFNIRTFEKREGIVEVFKSKEMLKRLLVGLVSRFTSNFVYYGLMVNSVWLPGDKYINFMLSTIASFPGELISLYLMNKIGRRLPLIYGFILCGVLCVLSGFVPDDMGWAKVTLFVSGKVVASVCFTGAITYSLELFPTSARGVLLSITAFTARIGNMLAPLTPILNDVSPVLPPLCFGASALAAGLLTILTPETKRLPLPDTIEQAEASVRTAKPNTAKQRPDDA